jgi:hypothetical protein
LNFLQNLLSGGPDYRVTLDIGGAVFAPAGDTGEALQNFQSVAEKIKANDGLGYRVIERLIHRSNTHAHNHIDLLVINILK